MEEYITVAKEAYAQYEEKKSRFISYISPVADEAEAVEFIKKIKTKHRDATHNVPAYVLRKNNIWHSSDDGEPSGTAGMPVLSVLQKENIVDACIVVTRYFGGILLGTGGLVRAYTKAAKLAVESAGIIKMAQCDICEITVDYNFYHHLEAIFNEFFVSVINAEFSDKVIISFSVKSDITSALAARITEQSGAKYSFSIVKTEFSKIK